MRINYFFVIFNVLITCSCVNSSTQTSFVRERDKKIGKVLKNFQSSMAKKGYYLGGLGEGIDHDTKQQKYLSFTFTIEQLPDIDFARKVELETIQEFLTSINSEEGIQDYLVEYPFTINYISIAFISTNPQEGIFIAANFEHELYYTKKICLNPYTPSKEIHRETYEEAIHILEEQKQAGKWDNL